MYRRKKVIVVLALPFLIGSALLLSSCGGGGGGTTPVGNGMISGTAVKGPVNGATVTAFAINNGTMGSQIGSGITDAQGNFNISIGNYSGPVMLQMSGGTYMDEATNTSMTMHSGDVMTSVIPSVTSGSTMTGIQITPLTSMAQKRADNMASRMTTTNMITANNAVGDYFMVFDILHTPPINPLVPGSGTGVTQDMKNYGMTIAAMSQYAQSIGMPVSSGIITAMMDDASDGIMDGMMGGNPISMAGMGGMGGGMMSSMTSTAGTVGLANAMTTFMTSTVNKSGLDALAMETLISKLTYSGGTIQ